MDRVSSRWTSLYQISEPKLSSDRRRGIGDTRARLNFKGLPIALNSFITAALMGTKAFTALLCGFALAGQMRGQEVVVGRETKPKPTERAATMSQPSDSESGNATPTKARVRAKKSTSPLPTVEQMRMAGALAGERLTNPPRIETTTRRESSPQKAKSDTVPAEPVRKEKRVEQSR